MTDQERKERENNKRVIELKKRICNKDTKDCEGYVFISYKSDDWDIVLTEIVYNLVFKYNLNVYFDAAFDLNNKSWIDQMIENMDAPNCVGIVAFITNKYATSYATLMELMHSQTFDACHSYAEGLPIIPINIEDLSRPDRKLGYEDTGLGKEDSIINLNAKAEKALFDEDYSSLKDTPKLQKVFKHYKYNKEDYNFTKDLCFDMTSAILSSKGYNTTIYKKDSKDDEFYYNLVIKIENTCGKEVFSKPLDTTIVNFKSQNIENTKPTQTTSVPKKASKEETAGNNTKNITYIIYGKEYTDNQSNMMLNVFAKVLKRHPNMIYTILENPEAPLIKCVSAVNYKLEENRTEDMKAYFNSGEFLNIGKGFYVGTTMNLQDKLKSIAQLLTICGEDYSVLQSKDIQLPKNVKISPSTNTGANFQNSNTESYSIYGKDYHANQSQMLFDVIKFIVEKNFDKRNVLSDNLLCFKVQPLSEITTKVYFRSGKEFTYEGVTYSIGTSFSRDDKIKQISKAIAICNEDISQFKIKGLDNVNTPRATSGKKGTRNFIDD